MTDGSMTGIDYFAWFVLIVIVFSVVGVFIALARLPGQIAQKRGHPQAEAINAAGWLGLLLTLGVVWALALVWAMTKPLVQVRHTDTKTDTKTDEIETEAHIDIAQEGSQ